MQSELETPQDFTVRKFYSYPGPNFYLNRAALVFNLYLDPNGRSVNFYEPEILDVFPQLEEKLPPRLIDLFAETLIQVLKMDIDLYLNEYSISRDGEEYVVAVEYFDEIVAEDAVHLVADWFSAMTEDLNFDFQDRFKELQDDFDRTLYGGPTIYSLIEAGLKQEIPVLYLPEENQFQWGYGKKQRRGRSTIFHTDGIKDTEFTSFKDSVKDFLTSCGFPTPNGATVFDEEEAVEEAEEIGYPVVIKPVAGHKGSGVTTNIQTEEDIRQAVRNILEDDEDREAAQGGIIVETYITGMDHRLLVVNGKFAAALERIPAYVEGNGKDTISELIDEENQKEIRQGHTRSPLARIKIDDDLQNFLELQDLSLSAIPDKDERIYLRRVANISAGGVSINVTDNIHPKNAKMAEDIAKFFNISVLGIDVLAEDISLPWNESSFGIIEINAGPGIFMHLAPAIGGSINVPSLIIQSHFPEPKTARVPIIVGNQLTLNFCQRLHDRLRAMKPNIEFGCLVEEGIFFNGSYFHRHKHHDRNVQILLRNPKLDFAVFNHTKDNIFDYGTMHHGADIVILEDPHQAEETLERDLLPGGYFIDVRENEIIVFHNDDEEGSFMIHHPEDKESVLMSMLEPLLKGLIAQYD